MFEVILSVCLLAQPGICRNVLAPGYETATIDACEKRLEASPPKFAQEKNKHIQPIPGKCVEAGTQSEFTSVAPGVFAHRGKISDAAADNFGDVANIGFVIGNSSIAVIDSGGSRKVAEQVYRAIRARSDLPISHVVLTHMHPDHVLGASLFAEAGAKVVGSASLSRALSDRATSYLVNFGRLIGTKAFIGTRIVTPDIEVDGKLSVDLGDRKLELQTWPRSHTDTDLTVVDTQTGILFAGDLVFHEHAPALDGSLTGWQDVLKMMAKMNVKQVVPGHGGPLLPWPSATAPLAQYLDVLETDARAAVKKGTTLAEAVETIAQSEADKWQLFELFNPRNATVAYTELEWE